VDTEKIRNQLRDILVQVAQDGMDCERGNLTRADVKERIEQQIENKIFPSLKMKLDRKQIEKAVIYVWHLAYDAGLVDGYGHYTKELETRKRPPPNAAELAKEAGLTI